MSRCSVTKFHTGLYSCHIATLTDRHTATLSDRHTATLTDRHTATLTDRHTSTLTDRHTSALTDRHTATLTDIIYSNTHLRHTAPLTDRQAATLTVGHTDTITDKCEICVFQATWQSLNMNPYPLDMALIFARDDTWFRLRNIMSPTFTGAKVKHVSVSLYTHKDRTCVLLRG